MQSHPSAQRLSLLAQKISACGKENLEEILHLLVEAVHLIVQHNRCRIYLEDLTSGSLSCVIATGLQARSIREQAFPINTSDFLVSRVYLTQEELVVEIGRAHV